MSYDTRFTHVFAITPAQQYHCCKLRQCTVGRLHLCCFRVAGAPPSPHISFYGQVDTLRHWRSRHYIWPNTRYELEPYFSRVFTDTKLNHMHTFRSFELGLRWHQIMRRACKRLRHRAELRQQISRDAVTEALTGVTDVVDIVQTYTKPV